MNALALFQFSYYPVIWMLHDDRAKNSTNKIPEVKIKIDFKDKHSKFKESRRKVNRAKKF